MPLLNAISSKTKSKVLRTLYYAQDFVALRQLASLSKLPVFSVQYALKDLSNDNLVLRAKSKNLTLFKLDPRHPYYHPLSELFEADTKMQLQIRAKSYKFEAKRALDFAHSFNQLFRKVKKP